MGFSVRTALVGAGLVAICIAMASLKGHYLLMAFAAASLLGSAWSWMQHSHKPVRKQPPVTSYSSSFARAREKSNVYDFPSASTWNVPDARSS